MKPTFEIERKFLVHHLPSELENKSGSLMQQGYLVTGEAEVRLRNDGRKRTLTWKKGSGLQRLETEIELTESQFEELWPATKACRVEKTRYEIPFEKLTVELDLYHGTHAPLKVAEVEFSSLDESKRFQPPEYFGAEITLDSRYKNQSLALAGKAPAEV